MAASGCIGGGPASVEAPDISSDDAVAAALKSYDQNGDKAFSGEELDHVPGIAMFLPEYDKDGDKSVSQPELTERFGRLFAMPGFTKLSCTVLFNNRPLPDAEVVFEPEPFMGQGYKTARGTTSGDGIADISIPNDQLPEANRRLGGGIYQGLYKVSVTHPTAKIPETYGGADTVLGHEVGNLTTAGSSAMFRLDSKGTKPY
jgi:hypothetical protein